MLCTNVYVKTCELVFPCPKAVYNCVKYIIVDSAVMLCSVERLCAVLNWMKVFVCIDYIVLVQPTSNFLIPGISFPDCLASSLNLYKDRR